MPGPETTEQSDIRYLKSMLNKYMTAHSVAVDCIEKHTALIKSQQEMIQAITKTLDGVAQDVKRLKDRTAGLARY